MRLTQLTLSIKSIVFEIVIFFSKNLLPTIQYTYHFWVLAKYSLIIVIHTKGSFWLFVLGTNLSHFTEQNVQKLEYYECSSYTLQLSNRQIDKQYKSFNNFTIALGTT